MSKQSFHNIWLHFIWGTKNRKRVITNEIKSKLIHHLYVVKGYETHFSKFKEILFIDITSVNLC